MHQVVNSLWKRIRAGLEALRGPQLALLALAFVLAVAWFGPGALLLAVPVLLACLAFLVPRWRREAEEAPAETEGQMSEMERLLDTRLRNARRDKRGVLCITLVIDGAAQPPRVDKDLSERIVTTCLDRLSHVLRSEDSLFDLGAARLGVVPAPAEGLDTDAAGRLAARLRQAADTALRGISGADSLSVGTGLRYETQPSGRTARAVIAESLADAKPMPGGAD